MISAKIIETGHIVGVVGNNSYALNGIVSQIGGTLSGQLYRYIGGEADIYTGEYVVTPIPFNDQVLETKEKLMADDVTVLAIPYYETSNTSGITVYIGGE